VPGPPVPATKEDIDVWPRLRRPQHDHPGVFGCEKERPERLEPEGFLLESEAGLHLEHLLDRGPASGAAQLQQLLHNCSKRIEGLGKGERSLGRTPRHARHFGVSKRLHLETSLICVEGRQEGEFAFLLPHAARRGFRASIPGASQGPGECPQFPAATTL
jgi:hypothetical protein